MHVILVDAISLDAKITRWESDNVQEWSSSEDKAIFRQMIQQSDVLIMGSTTYEAVKPRPQKECLRIVMTKNPKDYAEFSVPGQLEFTSESPEVLVSRLTATTACATVLLVGGNRLATSFFKCNLIDELWLTVEPRIFGQGKPLVLDERLDIILRLEEITKLNTAGTLLLKYTIPKSSKVAL